MSAAGSAYETWCARAVESLEASLSRQGIAAAAGNPASGASSTIGIRVGSRPRIAIAARLTFGSLETTRFGPTGPAGERSHLVNVLSLDGNIGVFDGFSPFATAGGMASIDAILSAGAIGSHAGPFSGGYDATFGLGARIGVVRESFSAPGITLSVMYRQLGVISFASGSAGNTVRFEVDDPSMWSYRAVVGKRAGPVGVSGGVGWDAYSSNGSVQIEAADASASDDDIHANRWNAFGSVVWTHLIVNMSGELGWQSAGDGLVSGGGAFVSFALRLVL